MELSDSSRMTGIFKTHGGRPSVAEVDPALARQWHPTLNGDLTAEKVTVSSGKPVVWLCSVGHHWTTRVDKRTIGRGCPYCAGKKIWQGYNDLAFVAPALARQWHPTLNGDLKPEQVTVSSNKPVVWLCSIGHHWTATVDKRTKGHGCPSCAKYGFDLLPAMNDGDSLWLAGAVRRWLVGVPGHC